jgi:hypothetical protein
MLLSLEVLAVTISSTSSDLNWSGEKYRRLCSAGYPTEEGTQTPPLPLQPHLGHHVRVCAAQQIIFGVVSLLSYVLAAVEDACQPVGIGSGTKANNSLDRELRGAPERGVSCRVGCPGLKLV